MKRITIISIMATLFMTISISSVYAVLIDRCFLYLGDKNTCSGWDSNVHLAYNKKEEAGYLWTTHLSAMPHKDSSAYGIPGEKTHYWWTADNSESMYELCGYVYFDAYLDRPSGKPLLLGTIKIMINCKYNGKSPRFFVLKGTLKNGYVIDGNASGFYHDGHGNKCIDLILTCKKEDRYFPDEIPEEL